jgi:transposase
MIATTRRRRRKITQAHQRQFLEMLPLVQRLAAVAFRDFRAEARQEAIAEVVAHAFAMYVALVKRGRENLAYAPALAGFGIRRVRVGRQAASRLNIKDVSSTHCQLNKGVKVKPLDRYDTKEGQWIEAVVEDSRTPPPDQAAFRIDFPAWLDTLDCRRLRIALTLATGERPSEVAEQFGVSRGKVSQWRAEFRSRWAKSHGEEAVA